MRRLLLWVLLSLGAAFFLLPLAWMLSTALKPVEQTLLSPPQWWPRSYFVREGDTQREVRLGALLAEPSAWVRLPSTGERVVLPERALVGQEWVLATGATRVIERERAVPASAERPWREVIDAVTGDRDFVPAEQIQGRLHLRWENFPSAIAALQDFWRYLGNSVLLCALNVLGTVLSSALVAYGFSRLEWRGRDPLFAVLLATMMIPFPVLMVPLYALFRELGWVGTLKPLWVGAFFASAFNVFLLRQFFRTLPRELSEAARLDGCSEFRIFWQIILPLCRPALVVVGLFTFLGTWNDFLGPLIYLTRQEDFTLALALQGLQTKSGLADWHHVMAASALVMAPVLLLFLFAQRALVEGIALTGGKS